MARFVQIGAVCGLPPYQAHEQGYAGCVRQATAFVREAVEQVLPDQPDLVVLPECCDRPQGYDAREYAAFVAERGLQVQDALAAIARENGVNIAYAAHIDLADGTRRNMIRYLNREGKAAGEYHKNHVMIEENTDAGLLYGRDAVITELDFGRVGSVICFDLNFEELRARYAAQRPDMMVFSSMYHGGLMQAAWAYGCRSYLVSAVGNLGCAVMDPQGTEIARSTNYTPFLSCRVNLDYLLAHLDGNGEKLRQAKKRYGRGITIKDPGLLGSVLLESEMAGISAADVAREFAIEPLDAYMSRSLKHRLEPGRMEE